MTTHFDILIIGGGHAGAEAAWAASHLLPDRPVALITMDPRAIARMSCNPAIGGLAKGQIVREIDALGGLMARAIDATGIQFRILNRSKGPAVQSPRAQADKYAYAAEVQRLLREECPNLTIIAGTAARLLIDEGVRGQGSGDSSDASPIGIRKSEIGNRRITGIALDLGQTLSCHAAILTTGTFLRGLMHTGPAKTEGGRIGEPAATGLSLSLLGLGFQLGRLKTGTPPRLASESIDFSALAAQPGDDPPVPFSFLHDPLPFAHSPIRPFAHSPLPFPRLPQVPCHITYTNAAVHDLIRANLHRAPMYSGQIQSRGPRYCPSIEDKVVRFADKTHHQVFLEPESLSTNEIYANGISTSLPADVQEQLVHAIPGLEHAVILKYGYAVEYDFAPTHQITASLETRLVSGLFFAGQINGTSGYEEAAGQGLLAGINAARHITGQAPFILTRDQAYIGVMIDDLITKTPTEPYRMFTSRAEFRLTLRSDNADQRLTPLAAQLGLATPDRFARLQAKLAAINELTATLQSARIDGTPALDLLRRPDITWPHIAAGLPAVSAGLIWGQVETQAKYAGYIERERRAAARLHELEDKTIPAAFDFAAIRELRAEARQALAKFRPQTVGQASRLEGITPADLTIVLLHLTGRTSQR